MLFRETLIYFKFEDKKKKKKENHFKNTIKDLKQTKTEKCTTTTNTVRLISVFYNKHRNCYKWTIIQMYSIHTYDNRRLFTNSCLDKNVFI